MSVLLEILVGGVIVFFIIRRIRSRGPQLQIDDEQLKKLIPQLESLTGLPDRVAELEQRVGTIEESVEFNTQLLLREGGIEEKTREHPPLRSS